MKCHFLLNKKFRQGSFYKLSEWNQLSQYQKELLVGLHDEAAIYGVFEPVTYSPELTCKVAYREVATLYLHLQHTEWLPHYFTISADEKTNEILARLVLDEIIQIEWDGNYVSGAAALPALYGDSIFDEQHLPNYLSGLSFKAIYYAWMLNDTDARSIANRLYTFNTVPWDAYSKSAFNKKNSIKEFLFSKTDPASQKLIQQQWQFNTAAENGGWLSWSALSSKEGLNAASASTFKLYISPLISDLPEVFMHFIPVISNSEAFSFKTGSTLQGLLRPDKMVAYFYTTGALVQTAAILREKLKSYTPQGVPFTAQLDETGLISHGTDPAESALNAVEGGSWRSSVTDQLALAILQAKKKQLNWQQTAGFIHAVMGTAGVDSYQWTETKELK